MYSQGVADYAVETIKNDGLVGNGPDDTLGNFDLDRVNDLIDQGDPRLRRRSAPPPKDGLTADDIVTNEFIDPSIGRAVGGPPSARFLCEPWLSRPSWCECSGPQVLVKVERPQRSEDERP